jgi:hypothetical protein
MWYYNKQHPSCSMPPEPFKKKRFVDFYTSVETISPFPPPLSPPPGQSGALPIVQLIEFLLSRIDWVHSSFNTTEVSAWEYKTLHIKFFEKELWTTRRLHAAYSYRTRLITEEVSKKRLESSTLKNVAVFSSEMLASYLLTPWSRVLLEKLTSFRS